MKLKLPDSMPQWATLEKFDQYDWIGLKRLWVDTRDFCIGYSKDDFDPHELSRELVIALKSGHPFCSLLPQVDLIKWLTELRDASGGKADWRSLYADLDGCRGWDLKYIRMAAYEDKFIVCNSLWYPIEWNRIIHKIDKDILNAHD